jgi:hypothetical protein
MSGERLFTTYEAGEQTGTTFRQLDQWAKREYVVPAVPAKGSGSTRLWSTTNLHEIRTVLKLVEACPFPHNHEGGKGRASRKARAIEQARR